MNASRKISPEGRAFIEKWEECVLYVYDDKVRKRHINGKLSYPEWDGTEAIGTLTIGYGHTDAAGYPKIKQGLKITKEQADEILGDDLQPCEADVKRLVKVSLGQHQFDALVSFTFNCGAGNLKKLIVRLNEGNYDDIPRRLMQFVSSKGERMQGLVNRRNGESTLWNDPDDPDESDVQEVFSPKGDENAPPKSIAESKTANSAITIGGAGALQAISAANDAAAKISDTKEKLAGLGLDDLFQGFLHSPLAIVALIGVALAAFIWWDRRRKLLEDHV